MAKVQGNFALLLQLALYVLSFLTPADLCRASKTCRYWRLLAEDNLTWKEKCKEGKISEDMVFESHFGPAPSTPLPYKHLYRRQTLIERNWVKKDISDPSVSAELGRRSTHVCSLV